MKHIDGKNYIRKCNGCGIKAYSLEDCKDLKFIPSTESKYGYRQKCYKCKPTNNSTQKMKDWKTAYQVNKRYGCTPNEYKQRMATSKCCEVCGNTEGLCYDHDHVTMQFRGVQCRGCNRALGQLGDNKEGILRVLTYLQKD